jgi:hypothetical protein
LVLQNPTRTRSFRVRVKNTRREYRDKANNKTIKQKKCVPKRSWVDLSILLQPYPSSPICPHWFALNFANTASTWINPKLQND